MRNTLFLFLAVTFLIPSSLSAAVVDQVHGRILLQVESHGEAWYVDPISDQRFYLRDGSAAYTALRAYGLGITNENLAMIPVGVEDRFEEVDSDGDGLGDKLEEALGTNAGDTDSDNDGFSDATEVLSRFNPLGSGTTTFNSALVNQLKGRILLQVESRGEAWYVHPEDGQRYYMADGEAAYQIMRYLSLGITNADLDQIPISDAGVQFTVCPDDDYACFKNAIEQNVSAQMNMVANPVLVALLGEAGTYADQRTELTFGAADGNALATYRQFNAYADVQFSDEYIQTLMTEGATREEVLATESGLRENLQQLVGYDIQCQVENIQVLADTIGRWDDGHLNSGDMQPFDCSDNATELGFVSQFEDN